MITIMGNLCNNGLVLHELLSRFSIKSQVITMPSDPPLKIKYVKFSQLDDTCIIEWRNEFRKKIFYDYIFSSNLVISNTASIIALGFKKYLNLMILSKVKHFNIATGSDFSEFLMQDSSSAKLFRYHVRHSHLNWVFPVPNVLENLRYVQPRNLFIAAHPFYLEPYRCPKISSVGSIPEAAHDKRKIIFLHASNIDWGASDNQQFRKSTKGSNRFLKQFIKASFISQNIHCYIIDRGPDKEEAKRIIEESRKEEFFTWLDPVNSEDLVKYITQADVVVDQFDIGCPGMIAIESMAQAKPVMIYIDKNYWPLVYEEEPPVINCYTEDEIYQAVLEWADKKKLQDLGERAEKWVRKYHDVHTADFSEFILRVCLTTGLEWPRKDLAKQAS